MSIQDLFHSVATGSRRKQMILTPVGTPVPFNPPKELIITGLYLRARNPMLTGVFACLLGTGFLLQSLSILLITTPLYIIAHVIELKRVEEPELERRFGQCVSPAYA